MIFFHFRRLQIKTVLLQSKKKPILEKKMGFSWDVLTYTVIAV